MKENIAEKKIVVLIPAYNAGKTIKRAIESVLTQTYGNWQVCVINDGSQDNTTEIVERNFSGDGRITLLSLPVGKGKTYALRYGIDYVKGADYAMFLDSDDWFKDSVLFEKLIYEFEMESVECICFNFEVRGRCGFSKINKKKVLCSDKEYIKNIMSRQYMDGNIWGGIYKYDIVKENFVTQDFNHEDYINKYNMLKKCSKVEILPIVGYVYSINVNGITHRNLSEEDKYYYIHVKEFTNAILDKYPDLKVECDYFSNWVLLWIIARLADSVESKKLKMYKPMMLTAKKNLMVFLFNPHFSFRERIRYLVIRLGIYRFAHEYYNKLQRIWKD